MNPTSSLRVPFSAEESNRAAFELDGRMPQAVVAPDTETACVELVRWAAAERFALVPWGGGTAIAQGNRLRAPQWAAVSTSRLAAMEEFSPDDMVVTAQSGLTLAALQKVLAERRQWIPIDAPQPEAATLGGIVATNAHGLFRPAFGLPRDRLLGVRVVLADGSVVRGGGKVVKNVAGYDLCKLFAGSWGTLGLMTEVTFKTNPLPEARASLRFVAKSVREALEAALQVHAARLQPAYLTVVSAPKGWGPDIGQRAQSPFLCVGLLGGAQAVAWQEAETTRRLVSAGLAQTEDGPSEDALRHLFTDLRRPALDVGTVSAPPTLSAAFPYLAVRLTVRPSDLPALAEDMLCLGEPTLLTAHVPTGIVEAALATPSDGPQDLFRQMARLVPPGGHLVWTHLPPEWKAELDVWGATRGDFGLMRGVKAALDPGGLFSPGRFIGRL